MRHQYITMIGEAYAIGSVNGNRSLLKRWKANQYARRLAGLVPVPVSRERQEHGGSSATQCDIERRGPDRSGFLFSSQWISESSLGNTAEAGLACFKICL